MVSMDNFYPDLDSEYEYEVVVGGGSVLQERLTGWFHGRRGDE